MPLGPSLLIAGSLVLALGCSRVRREDPAEREPIGRTTLTSAEKVGQRGLVETVEVPRDHDVSVVVGENTKRPIVYLGASCSAPREDLETWGPWAAAHGTVVALIGDAMCPGRPGRTRWSTDLFALDARIGAAIEAVHWNRGVDFDPASVVLVGLFDGADRALALAMLFHAKYTRIVLVGPSHEPIPRPLAGARGVALLDVPGGPPPHPSLVRGARALASTGLRARFWDLEGRDAGPQISEALGFVSASR